MINLEDLANAHRNPRSAGDSTISYNLTIEFFSDLMAWLGVFAESKYSVLFNDHSEQEQREIICTFVESFTDSIPEYLQLKESYINTKIQIPYHHFKVKRSHIEVVLPHYLTRTIGE